MKINKPWNKNCVPDVSVFCPLLVKNGRAGNGGFLAAGGVASPHVGLHFFSFHFLSFIFSPSRVLCRRVQSLQRAVNDAWVFFLIPRQGAQPASEAPRGRGKRSPRRETQPPGTLSGAFKKSILLFLLPLPFPSRRKQVRWNISTETTMLNKSAQPSLKPGWNHLSRKTVPMYLEWEVAGHSSHPAPRLASV